MLFASIYYIALDTWASKTFAKHDRPQMPYRKANKNQIDETSGG